MRNLLYLLIAGLVFITPTAALASIAFPSVPCFVGGIPHVAQCSLFGHIEVFA